MSRSASVGVPTASSNVDVVVVGGGAAGLSAAKTLARSRRSVLVVDAGAPRNAPAEGVHNYLYAEGTPPGELVAIGRTEAQAYGVEVAEATATAATVVASPAPGGSRFTLDLATRGGVTRTVGARRVVLATGLLDVLPDVEGLAARWGRDVLHCPFCHGWEVRDQAVGVIGTGPMALHTVQLFRALTPDVVYFQHTNPDLTDEQRELLAALGVRHVVGQVAQIETTDDALTGVAMADGQVVSRKAVAITTVLEGRTDLVADLGLAMTDVKIGDTVAGSYLPADASGLTGTPGVWAAGNLSAPLAQVITSAAAGGAAGAAIHLDLMAEDNRVAVDAHRARIADRSSRYWDHRVARMVAGTGTSA